jgi:multiple sugar transport system substrate-binding protein
MRPSGKKWFAIVALMIVATIMLVSCGGTAEPETVEVTRIVQAEPEVIEVTRIVEGEVVTEQIEVTRVVEVEVPGEAEETGLAAILNEDVSGSVEMWHFWGSPVRRNAIRRIVAMCDAALPNIEITETFKPFGDIWTANIAAVAAGSGMPGVIVEDRPQLPQRAADSISMNLQPFIDRDNLDMSVFWPFTVDEARSPEGDIYGIPFETDVRVLFWNKQLFEQAGLDPERPPQTWDELEEFARQLEVQADDGSWERIGFMPLWNAGPNFWAFTNGWEQVVDGRPNYDDPAYIETLEWIKEWVDYYGGWQEVQNFRASYGAAPNDLFMSGAVPMFVDVAGYLSQLSFYRPRVTLDDDTTVNMDWGVAAIPYNAAPGNWSGGFALSIPEGAPDADAAWEFIKCASSAEGQASWARDTYAIPTNSASATVPELMADPYWVTIMEVMEHSRGSTYVPEYPNFGQEVNPREEQVWTGALTPEEAAQEIQGAIDAEMGN